MYDVAAMADPVPHTWEGAKTETSLTEILFLPASSNMNSFVDSAMFVLELSFFWDRLS